MNPNVHITVDFDRLRANAVAVQRQVGVPILAVVKADAYGLGADHVMSAISEMVDGFCFFNLDEALSANAWRKFGKPSITIGPVSGDPREHVEARIRPAVWTVEDAKEYRLAGPILSVDTGMQRFACPVESFEQVLAAGDCREAMTHAIRSAQAVEFKSLLGGRGIRLHAASSSLLHVPEARLDAVRPGLALYRGVARITTLLLDVRQTRGPAGYTGFQAATHGVIGAGYAHGLRPGPCQINGHNARVIEVGMQSAFVECSAGDRPGDEVLLLGDDLDEATVAAAWGASPHSVLLALARMAGLRHLDRF